MRPYSDFAPEYQVANRLLAVVTVSMFAAIALGALASALLPLQVGVLFVVIAGFVVFNLLGAWWWVNPVDRAARQAYEAYLATLDPFTVCAMLFDPTTSEVARPRIHAYLKRTWPQWGKSA